MNIKVQPALHGDCDVVAPLFDAYRQYYGQTPDVERARQFIGARLSREESVILLAMLDGNAAGFVQLYPAFTSVHTARIWILNDLFVSPPARRKGVARALLQAARDYAAEQGSRGLVLETLPDNQPAQALYRDMGWELDGTLHFQLMLD